MSETFLFIILLVVIFFMFQIYNDNKKLKKNMDWLARKVMELEARLKTGAPEKPPLNRTHHRA
jgi:hypothetical protein